MLCISWIQTLIKVTIGCDRSHKSTKYTIASVRRISCTIFKCYTRFFIYNS
jgi:hypothetical protein